MACPFRVVLVIIGALWALVTLTPSKAMSWFGMGGMGTSRIRWPFLVLVLALHVDFFMQLGCTSCTAKFVAEAVKFVAEAATATRMAGDLVDYFKSAPALEQALLS
jgi:hypothetical protein